MSLPRPPGNSQGGVIYPSQPITSRNPPADSCRIAPNPHPGYRDRCNRSPVFGISSGIAFPLQESHFLFRNRISSSGIAFPLQESHFLLQKSHFRFRNRISASGIAFPLQESHFLLQKSHFRFRNRIPLLESHFLFRESHFLFKNNPYSFLINDIAVRAIFHQMHDI